MTTICLTCGKVGTKKCNPVIMFGKEIPSHVTCDEFCIWGTIILMMWDEPQEEKEAMFYDIIGDKK